MIKNKKTILITGPNGFIGKQFLEDLYPNRTNFIIKIISRTPTEMADFYLSYNDFIIGRYEKSFFEDVQQVVHLASIAHQFKDVNQEVLASVNSEYLKKILDVLNPEKLEIFLHLSSYAVTLLEKNIILDTHIYAEFKQKNEKQIIEMAHDHFKQTSFTILRPPLVYGRGAPGNFEKLLKIIRKPLPLPFGQFYFSRSFIHVKNLTSFMHLILSKKNEIGVNVLEVADPWDETFLSFITRLKKTLNAPSLILPIPLFFIRFGLRLLGKNAYYKKLSLEFKIDYKSLQRKYEWTNPIKKEDSFFDLKE